MKLYTADEYIPYVFLLLVNMTNLEVDVFLSQWTWRVIDDVFKALQALIELLLLFVYYSKAEVNFIGLFKVWGHAHDLRKGLLGMVKRPIAIIENANAVPQLGLLWNRTMKSATHPAVKIKYTNLGISEVIERLLIRSVGFLQVVHHKVAVAWDGMVSPGNTRTISLM